MLLIKRGDAAISRSRRGLKRINIWVIYALLIALLVGTPLATIVYFLFDGPSDTWKHLSETVLGHYVANSLLLILGVSAITLILGVSTAWVVSTCNFPGRKIFEWALVLPLSVPTYIIAFAYAGITDYTGPIQTTLRNWGLHPDPSFFEIMNLQGVMLVMAFVLYPYVYVITRASFSRQTRNILESGRILGSSPSRTFFSIALPIARPAIVAGVSLVIMEVLNDYGAVKYFGVSTFTTGIFRAWFSLGDVNAAIYLSSLLLVVIFLVLGLERLQRGKARFDDNSPGSKPISKFKLSKPMQAVCVATCFMPVFFGFILPTLQLMGWSLDTAYKVVDLSFFRLIFNSFSLAAGTAMLCAFLSVILIYAVKINPTFFMRVLGKFSVMGYAIPGAVIAVGVMMPLLFLDKSLTTWLQNSFGITMGLLISGTIGALIFAYIVRFLAVAYNPIDSGFKKVSDFYTEASRGLGVAPLATLWKVNLPLIKGSVISAALLVFVDVLKELPLTLIMRPFNFNTLATKTFELASDEMVAESSVPALIIIATGIVPIIFLSKWISKT